MCDVCDQLLETPSLCDLYLHKRTTRGRYITHVGVTKGLISAGSDIPGQASLVFDVVLLDLHNPRDGISVTNQIVSDSCTRKTVSGDFIRYHYNGSLLDGTFFDSRCVLKTKVPPLKKKWKCASMQSVKAIKKEKST